MSTINVQLFYPMFAMFLLSGIVLIKMFLTRVAAVKGGAMNIKYFRTYSQGDASEDVIKTGRHFTNLFEAPVLFYVVCLIGMFLGVTTGIFTGLAWAYFVCRVLHAIIHMGANRLKFRMGVYGISWLVLLAMWVLIFLRVFQTPVGSAYGGS